MYRVQHKKQPPKKNSISRKPCNLNSWNLHHIILRRLPYFLKISFISPTWNRSYSCLNWKRTILQLLTQRHWRRTGLAEIAKSLSGRKSGHRIRLISTLLTIMCGVRCLTSINAMYRSQRTFRSWRPSWRRSDLTCHKAQLMKQYYHFAKCFWHALKQLVDILNMLCKLMFVTLTFFPLQLRHLLFRVITGWLELLFTE